MIKHMPGHGRAVADSHYELPSVGADHRSLALTDFAPFRALNDVPMGMTAHLVFSDIDDQPATLSPKVMRIIRDEIGFDGLIMTDDIGMKALNGSPAEISAGAIAAGCDVVLTCNAPLDSRAEAAEAAGAMTDAAQRRAERALAARKTPDDVDIAGLSAELEALVGELAHGG